MLGKTGQLPVLKCDALRKLKLCAELGQSGGNALVQKVYDSIVSFFAPTINIANIEMFRKKTNVLVQENVFSSAQMKSKLHIPGSMAQKCGRTFLRSISVLSNEYSAM